MTYENCKKYMDEAQEKSTKEFWAERIKRKYPEKSVIEKIVEEVKPIKSKVKK